MTTKQLERRKAQDEREAKREAARKQLRAMSNYSLARIEVILTGMTPEARHFFIRTNDITKLRCLSMASLATAVKAKLSFLAECAS